MRLETFHIVLIAAALTVAAPPDRSVAQTSDSTASETFSRRYIDAQARRSSRVLLRDWPELTRLLTWTRQIETVVTAEDETLSAELVDEFRARIDTLASMPVPGFLASRSDSVKATFDSIRSRLDRAGEALEAAPPTVRPEEGAASNTPDRERTLVTGKTAVTVPSGVAVGDRDTLPRAAIEGEEASNYVDLVALALADLDRLVHLVRKTGGDGVSEPPSTEAPAPTRRTAPPPEER